LAFIPSIVGTVKGLFLRKPPRAGAAGKRPVAGSKVPEAAADAARRKSETLAALEEQLKRLVDANGSTTAGRFQILVLDEIRDRMAGKWDRLCDQVNLVVEKIIKTHTGPKDIFYAHGDLKYLLIFAELTAEEATRECLKIRDEIYKALFGASPSGSTGITNGMDGQDVNIVTAVAVIPDDINMPASDSGGALMSGLMQTLETLTQTESAAGRKQEGSVTTDARTRRVEAGSQLQEDLVPKVTEGARNALTVADTIQEHDVTSWKSGDISDEAVMKPLQGLRYAFKPIWSIDERRIRYLAASPIRQGPDGAMVSSYAAIGQGAHEKSRAALDLAVLSHTLEAIVDLSAIGDDVQIILPVNFSTLSSTKNLGQFRKACSVITEQQREKLVFEIVDVPAGIPESGLNGAIGNVLLFCAGVAVRKALEDPKFAVFKGSGANMVSFSLMDIPLDEEQLMDAMDKFVTAASLARLSVFSVDMPSKNAVAAAAAMGVPLIGSSFVTDISELPKKQQSYAIENLFGTQVD
jgi:hypothetical protein